MSRRNVWIPDELWERAERAAYKLSNPGERVSVAELIRRGLARECDKVERDE